MRVRNHVPLAPLTTLGVGGNAETLWELDDLADLPEVIALAAAEQITPVCLGEGSNVLVADSGCSTPVLRIATRGLDLRELPDGHSVEVTAQAGHLLQDLVETSIAEGLTGIETLIGIPGTVGATPVQNVGAYGQEIADTLQSVQAWDWQAGRPVTLTNAQCGLGHRTSIFKHSDRWTLLSVTLTLRRSELSAPMTYRPIAHTLDVPLGTQVPLKEAAEAVLTVRRGKGMVLDHDDPDHRSVGSVFLSPAIGPVLAEQLRARQAPVNEFPDGTTRVSASWLIKEAGFTLGQRLEPGVRVSSKHFTLVADDGATAAGFAKASATVAHQVEQATGVLLTPEPDLIGAEPTYVALATRSYNEHNQHAPAGSIRR